VSQRGAIGSSSRQRCTIGSSPMAAANALKRRGSLAIWFDPTMTWEAAPTGKRGRPPDYSGEADQKTVRV